MRGLLSPCLNLPTTSPVSCMRLTVSLVCKDCSTIFAVSTAGSTAGGGAVAGSGAGAASGADSAEVLAQRVQVLAQKVLAPQMVLRLELVLP